MYYSIVKRSTYKTEPTSVTRRARNYFFIAAATFLISLEPIETFDR